MSTVDYFTPCACALGNKFTVALPITVTCCTRYCDQIGMRVLWSNWATIQKLGSLSNYLCKKKSASSVTDCLFKLKESWLIPSPRLRSLMWSKLNRMGSVSSRMNSKQRKQLFERWEKSDWELTIKASEIICSSVVDENAHLALQLESVKREIRLRPKKYTVHFYLGADWEFVAMACGIIQCMRASGVPVLRYKVDKEWSITDVKKGVRTISSISASKPPAKSPRRFNCSLVPPSFKLQSIVSSTICIFLRITET